MTEANRILDFWLQEVGPAGWYKQDQDLDARIKAEFEELWLQAMSGDLWNWRAGARGSLSYLLLTDQFSFIPWL